MSRLHVRHLVEKPGARGPRWFWQPSAALRAAGWKSQRLAANTLDEAIKAAEDLNAQLDQRRAERQLGKAARPAGSSVAAMIAAYKTSKWWPKGERTRKDYSYYLRDIEAWAGDMPARAITSVAVQAFHSAMEKRTEGKGRKRVTIHTPARAAAAIRVLSALLSAGRQMGFVATNVALGAGMTAEPQREPVLWTVAQRDHLVATADAMGWRSQGTAMILNWWAGQRQADVLNLPPWHVEQGTLVLRQRKTRRQVPLPLHLVPELVARLEAERGRAGAVTSLTHMLLHDRTGRPWLGHTFTHVFAEIRELAAKGGEARAPDGTTTPIAAMPSVAHLLWMELRHTAVTQLHLAGMDALKISGVTGHTAQSVAAILERHYLIRTSEANEDAFKARLAKEGGT